MINLQFVSQILSKKLIVNVLLSAAIIISGTMLVLYMLLEDGKVRKSYNLECPRNAYVANF